MRYQDDQTRKMLNVIRESNLNKKELLKEQEDDLSPVDQMMPDEVESDDTAEDRDLETSELKEEQDKFRKSVHNRVEFNKFKLYPNSQNVEFSGMFTDSRIEWFYSLDDSRGVYISADLLQLRDDTLEVIKKLVGYYSVWSDEWANRISEEYNNTLNDDDGDDSGFEQGDDLPDDEPFA